MKDLTIVMRLFDWMIYFNESSRMFELRQFEEVVFKSTSLAYTIHEAEHLFYQKEMGGTVCASTDTTTKLRFV